LAEELAGVVPTPREFVWELGSGHGHFLTAYAQAHPHELCLGVDIVGERVERAVRKRDRARLGNLAFFHAEGRLFLETLPHHARVKRVFILFPDPWPKSRHHKHRIIQPQFLDQLTTHSTDDCRLYFRTDFDEYYEQARATIARHRHWEVIEALWPFEFATVFQSRAIGHQSLIARRVAP
jgi:tRNA (guanine-N7-)-methyltransferase